MRNALLPLLLLLSSCSTVSIDATVRAWWCLGCIAIEVDTRAKKEPADAGSKTKSTEDFSDPQKDEAPKADADKNQPVKPQR